jgi:hypothetical protein
VVILLMLRMPLPLPLLISHVWAGSAVGGREEVSISTRPSSSHHVMGDLGFGMDGCQRKNSSSRVRGF